MPFVRVLILEGRTQDQKDAMYVAVTKALCETIDVAPEQVRVVVEDWPKGDYSHAGISALARATQPRGVEGCSIPPQAAAEQDGSRVPRIGTEP